ncbi:MAG TPA: SCO family protein [Spongiibacteraceae bacterium]|nr:SCO family protein [Spongiibacteraceae bacterium]
MRLSRRTERVLAAISLATIIALISGCSEDDHWHAYDVSGKSAPLQFTLTRAGDGKTVTAADYRGKVVLLYFGYTFCPDACPTTLLDYSRMLSKLGTAAQQVRVLFVTVDPQRDTPPILSAYVKNFAPQVEGLRGTPDQLVALTRRYRAVYSVTPATPGHPYDVTHSSATYVFDKAGNARLLISPLLTSTPKEIAGVTADLKRLIAAKSRSNFLTRWLRMP